ncbi:bifunctional metallophosphatase/5'-nucleotidase [Vibrio maerlii]|uniref:bifunctional metallophosphatase/5'-nucleotidase n=1 Tax=Vibrio maerlii TaxID=2231648 RepID=UPI000E3D836A|nr:bifunctional UDP-sugar hydrolase/5'-nucleotidase [Vibrio maerlii]
MKRTSKPVKVTLAHINDTHSYFEPSALQLTVDLDGNAITPYVSAGGFARIAARRNQLKQHASEQGRHFLFLHAGDCFQGTLYFSLFKGKANADMLSALNLDAMTIGNHELDMGNEPVVNFAKRIGFPLLAGNWDISQELTTKTCRLNDCENIKPYQPQTNTATYIVKEFDEEPVAIFGLSLDKMMDIAQPDTDTPFVNAIQVARNTVEQLNKQGINKIILLSHLGYEGDMDLAEQVKGISLIVGGHSHKLQGDFSSLGLGKDDEYGLKVNDTRIVQAGFHSLTMGHCEIDFSESGEVTHFTGKNELLLGRQLFLNASMDQVATDDTYRRVRQLIDNHPNVSVCKKDHDTQAILVEKYMPKVRELQRDIIGYAPRKLRHVRLPDEKGASEIAPLVAESFLFTLGQDGIELDFAIHNAGGVRNSLNEGKISTADIAGKLLPFAVPIGYYSVSGHTIAAILEGAIDNAINNGVEGTGSGSYPYTYNLKFDYLASQPQGKRIANLLVYKDEQWQSVKPDTIYRGTSSAYTMKGKEGYNAILNTVGTVGTTQYSMADCMVTFLKDDPNKLAKVCRHFTQVTS